MKVLRAILLVSIVACSSEVPPDELPPEIAPLSGAIDVEAHMFGEDSAATYSLISSYPADEVLQSIYARFESESWRPREFDHLNPTIPTSHVRGWTHYYHAPKRAWVHHWSSEWEHRTGALVKYDLQYVSPGTAEDKPDQPIGRKLEVLANYVSADIVESEGATGASEVITNAASESETVEIVDPDFVVLRPVSSEAAEGRSSAPLAGRDLYFDMDYQILDLRHLDLLSADVEQGSDGEYAVFVATTEQGAQRLRAWTSVNVGSRLGMFLDRHLISAPIIRTPITSMIVIESAYTREEAEQIAARIRRGGADI